jgi:hypothetical protein
MATAGVSIASAAVEEEGTSGSAEAVVGGGMHRIVDVGRRPPAAVTAAVMPQQHAVALLMRVRRMVGPRIAVFLTVADRMVPANTTRC